MHSLGPLGPLGPPRLVKKEKRQVASEPSALPVKASDAPERQLHAAPRAEAERQFDKLFANGPLDLGPKRKQ
ncbi:MAG: hypothetical protein ABI643_01105 [Candidatus Doudnabacteria bacterium]